MDHIIALKSEQSARIVMRETALYVQLGSIFAAYAVEGQAGQNLDLVNVIRISSMLIALVMISIYLSNDYYVTRISNFIKSASIDKFSEWENTRKDNIYYQFQKHLRTLSTMIVFLGWEVFQAVRLGMFEQPMIMVPGFISLFLVLMASGVLLRISYWTG